jgi:hypothetical protein
MNSEEDGKAEHHINQYIIKDEIGRGSFGAVHLAVDQYGTEYVSIYCGPNYKMFWLISVLGCQRVLEIEITKAGSVEYP